MAAKNIVEINATNFQEVIGSDTPVLVDFWAPWCGPCRMIAPIIEQLAEEANGKYTVGKINVDENGEIAAKYQVMSIPTVFVFKSGQAVDSVIGLRTKADLAKMLEKHV